MRTKYVGYLCLGIIISLLITIASRLGEILSAIEALQ